MKPTAHVCVLVCALGCGFPTARATPTAYIIDPLRSRLSVHVARAGILSSLLHDQLLVVLPAALHGRVRSDPAQPKHTAIIVQVDASGLRDRMPRVRKAERDAVDARARGPSVLDAGRHPTIQFTADQFVPSRRHGARAGSGILDGVLEGRLTVHGETQPLSLPVRADFFADGIHATGELSLKQSDFKIEPYSKGGGAFAVEDRVDVRFDVIAVPAPQM